MKLPKSGTKVLLKWLDAFGRGGWNNERDIDEEIKNPIQAQIIGYFLKANTDFIVLSMGIQNDPNSSPFLHLEFIPRGSVKELKILSEK